MTGRAELGDPRPWELTEEGVQAGAVRPVATSGRTVAQVAADLGIGKSTLTHWRRRFEEAELLAGPHLDHWALLASSQVTVGKAEGWRTLGERIAAPVPVDLAA